MKRPHTPDVINMRVKRLALAVRNQRKTLPIFTWTQPVTVRTYSYMDLRADFTNLVREIR